LLENKKNKLNSADYADSRTYEDHPA
jgi:hypothetical protein